MQPEASGFGDEQLTVWHPRDRHAGRRVPHLMTVQMP